MYLKPAKSGWSGLQTNLPVSKSTQDWFLNSSGSFCLPYCSRLYRCLDSALFGKCFPQVHNGEVEQTGWGELTWALDWWEKGRTASNVSPTVPALVGQSWVFEITTRWLISISVGLCETPTVVQLLFENTSSISGANVEIMLWVWPILFYCKYWGNFWQSSLFTLMVLWINLAQFEISV